MIASTIVRNKSSASCYNIARTRVWCWFSDAWPRCLRACFRWCVLLACHADSAAHSCTVRRASPVARPRESSNSIANATLYRGKLPALWVHLLPHLPISADTCIMQSYTTVSYQYCLLFKPIPDTRCCREVCDGMRRWGDQQINHGSSETKVMFLLIISHYNAL